MPEAPKPAPPVVELDHGLRTDHFAMAEKLLKPNMVWAGEAKGYVLMQATHTDQRLASIHSNLAKIHEMKTSSLIRYAELLPAVPQYLLDEIASRLGVEAPDA